MKYGEMAFPGIEIRGTGTAQTRVYHRGMSLRDWFAGKVLAGIVSDSDFIPPGLTGTQGDETAYFECTAKWCYKMADAMIRERAKHE